VSEDDAHRSHNHDRSVGAFAVKPCTFGVPLCGIGLDRSERPSKSGDRAADALLLRCYTTI